METQKIEVPTIDMDKMAQSIADKMEEFISEQVSRKVRLALVEKIEKSFSDSINSMAEAALSEFLHKKMYRTNGWGEQMGDEITLTEFILDRFEKHMQQKVDYQGRIDRNGLPRSEYMIREFGLKEIEKVAAKEIQQVRKLAEAQISSVVGQFIAQNLVAPVAANALTQRQ